MINKHNKHTEKKPSRKIPFLFGLCEITNNTQKGFSKNQKKSKTKKLKKPYNCFVLNLEPKSKITEIFEGRVQEPRQTRTHRHTVTQKRRRRRRRGGSEEDSGVGSDDDDDGFCSESAERCPLSLEVLNSGGVCFFVVG
jgi:hypothetical protein